MGRVLAGVEPDGEEYERCVGVCGYGGGRGRGFGVGVGDGVGRLDTRTLELLYWTKDGGQDGAKVGD